MVHSDDRSDGSPASRPSWVDAALGSVPIMAFRLSPEAVFLEVNAAEEDLYAGPAEAIVGRSLGETLPAHVAVPLEGLIREVGRSGGVRHPDYSLEKPGEGRRSFRAHLAPGGDGTVVAIVQDLTEFRDTRRRLRVEQDRLRDILELTGIGIWEWELETGSGSVSEQWARALGYSADELLPHDADLWRRMTHPDDLETALGVLEDYRSGGRGQYAVDIRMRHRNGQWVWIHSQARFSDWDENGEPSVLTGVNVEITRMKQAEEDRLALNRRMLHGQKLESLGVLAGGVAHDFNNILTTILGHTELATTALGDRIPAVRESLGRIEVGVRQATRLTEQMLAYSGRTTQRLESLDLGELARGMIDFLRSSVGRHVTLTTSFAAELPRISADRSQVEQVLLNLMTNASEALEGRPGEIHVSAAVREWDPTLAAGNLLGTELRRPPQGVFVQLSVSDTGTGMTPETLERIAEPFFTTKFQGRGLGMAAVFGIVRAHGGGILVTTESGAGTTFEVLFPGDTVSVPRVKPSRSPGEPRVTPGRVLIVDDEEAVRVLVRTALTSVDYDVEVAEHGRQAVELLEADPSGVDLVLLDLTMPEMDGHECLRILRSRYPSLPVVMMSGFPPEALMGEDQDVRPDAFIQKPFRIGQLYSTLSETLRAAGAD